MKKVYESFVIGKDRVYRSSVSVFVHKVCILSKRSNIFVTDSAEGVSIICMYMFGGA